MNNLICNSSWRFNRNDEPDFFTTCGPVTWDETCFCGCRTASVSIPTCCEDEAAICYEYGVHVYDAECLRFGCCMRAMEADKIYLRVDYFGRSDSYLCSCKKDISQQVKQNFHNVAAEFRIPCQAVSAKLTIEFQGRVTACSVCAPYACYCDNSLA